MRESQRRRIRRTGSTTFLCTTVAVLGMTGPGPLAGQAIQVSDRSLLVPGDTIEVVPGERYRAGGFRRLIFGRANRDLWTATVRVPVIDLDRFAGGITAFRTGGFGQTNTLHFRTETGRRYTFRSVDKAPERGLPDDLKGTIVADIRQDFVSALHPGAALVAAPILEAAGVLHVNPRLIVLPDHERLGEFRDTFAGMLGYVEERPNEGPDESAGFAGLTSIVGDERIEELLEDGPENRVDSRAFLVARLVDFILGDRDRHPGQWRWGRVTNRDGRDYWWPIPEDRDEALIHYDGIVMSVYTKLVPKIVSFSDRYPDIAWLAFNGWDLDRRFLPELEAAVWDSVARALQQNLSDEVIDDAVGQLPEGFREVSGEGLRSALRARRDGVVDAARDYYRFLLREVEITATDADEVVTISFVDEGVRVRIELDETDGREPGEPYYLRTFHNGETAEVRIYLKGGDDEVVTEGAAGRIRVRVIGGGGGDRYRDATQGAVHFYDDRGDNTIASDRGRSIDETDFDRPDSPEPLHRYARDWGAMWTRFPLISAEPDIGFSLGLSATRRRFGFRKSPYSNRTTIEGDFATGVSRAALSLTSHWRAVAPGVDVHLRAAYSGFEIVKFHGFGNETDISGLPDALFSVVRQSFSVAPTVTIAIGESAEVSAGPVVKYATTENEALTILGSLAPPGSNGFGQVGGRLEFSVDRRDRPVASSQGLLLTGGAAGYPALWDAAQGFGEVHGSLSLYASAAVVGSPTLAVRFGAKRVWGTYPFHEAAFLGGANDLRGFAQQRFAGDAAVFGNVELRFAVTRTEIIVPGEMGVFGLADAGRVYLTGENSDELHTTVGGGVWFSFLNRMNTLSIAVARSAELSGFYLRSGFMF